MVVVGHQHMKHPVGDAPCAVGSMDHNPLRGRDALQDGGQLIRHGVALGAVLAGVVDHVHGGGPFVPSPHLQPVPSAGHDHVEVAGL